MSTRKNRYAFKGLDEIFGESLEDTLNIIDSKVPNEEVKKATEQVDVNLLKPNPYQPRKSFDEDSLQELANSIKIHGIIQPIIVSESDNNDYFIIAGERRTRAAKLAGLKKVPVLILKLSIEQMYEFALIENVQRVDLLDIEEAVAYKALNKELNLTQEEIALRVGKSRSHVANIMRLLNLPNYVQEAMINKIISMGQAKPLLTIANDEKKVKKVYDLIVNKDLSSREVEKIIKNISNNKNIEKTIKKNNLQFSDIENKMIRKLNTKVLISDKKIQILFSDTKDLNRILELLNIIED